MGMEDGTEEFVVDVDVDNEDDTVISGLLRNPRHFTIKHTAIS